MAKKNRKKNKKKNANGGKVATISRHPEVQASLNEETQKKEYIKAKHENRQMKIKNISETIEQLLVSFMRLSCFCAFTMALIAIFIAIIVSLALYILKQNEMATVFLTVLQVLTGIVSLVIGIWALVLTIQTNHKNPMMPNKLNIVVSSADTIVTQIQEESDVNLSSL